MLLEIVAGPLKGEMRRVHRDGATMGRATESTIRSVDASFFLFWYDNIRRIASAVRGCLTALVPVIRCFVLVVFLPHMTRGGAGVLG